MADVDPYRTPTEERERREPRHERVAAWWRVLFPICSFAAGVIILLIEAAVPEWRSNAMIGVGLVLAGLGPAGLIDVIKKMPG